MRIRQIKPEFWTSEDIAALDWPTRLVFIGMLSYVDDNGVGRDVEKLITSSLFPLEEDQHATRMQITCSLQRLHTAGLIERYEADGRPFLEITGFSKHQYIPRPNKPRYPTANAENSRKKDPQHVNDMQVAANNMQSSANSLRGSEGQRVRGPEGQSLVPLRTDVTSEQNEIALAHDPKFGTLRIIHDWQESSSKPIPGKVVADVKAQIAPMLQQGIDPNDIRAGLAEWWEGKYPASTIPNYVARAGRPQAKATGTSRATDILNIDTSAIEF
jgi:hypothetical protein